MRVKIVPYLVFFLASLGFAYYVSGPTPQKQGNAQEWKAIAKGSVNSISFESEGKTTAVRREGNTDSYWIDTTAIAKGPDGDKEEKDRFLANDKLKEVLESIYSFQVEKVIGAAKDLKLEEFGLDKPNGRFEVVYAGDKAFKLALGKRGFQSAEIFALDEEKQSVILVSKQFFAPLERAKARLALTSPYVFDLTLVSAASLSAGEKHAEYVRQGKGESKSWYARTKLDAPDEAFNNWLDKLLKVRIESYGDAAQNAVVEQMPRKFSVLLKGDKEELDLFAIFEDGGSTPPRYWMKSRRLPVPVQIEGSSVATLIADLPALVR